MTSPDLSLDDAPDNASVTEQANQAPEPGLPGGSGNVYQDVVAAGGQFLQGAAQGLAALTHIEQQLTSVFGAIPFPALPALRVLDFEVGLPHGHFHPPNLIPPIIPVPIPLPCVGPVLPIPFLSGAASVQINGQNAARCGDMGVSIWCGSYFPFFEIFLGSCNVWIEGARAARVGVDVTTHCIFAAPKPQDPPCYPWVGFPISGSGDVLIGGVPLPSLVSMAIGAMFKALFNGFSRILRRIRAQRAVNRFLRNADIGTGLPVPATRGVGLTLVGESGAIRSLDNFTDDALEQVMADLRKIAGTPEGRALLRELADSKFRIRIEPGMPQFFPDDEVAAHVRVRPGSDHGMFEWNWVRQPDGSKRLAPPWMIERGTYDIVGNGPGSGGVVFYSTGGGSDEALMHELVHARNATRGGMRSGALMEDGSFVGGGITPAGGWGDGPNYMSLEEYSAVTEGEDIMRAVNGREPRDGY